MVCNATAAMALLALACAALPMHAQQLTADAGWRDVSLVEYHQHLLNLDALVAACQAQHQKRDAAQPKVAAQTNAQPSSVACDPARVGPNDHVQLPAGGAGQIREVRYDWLRSVLSRASGKGGTAQAGTIGLGANGKNARPSMDVELTQARERLQEDAKQAESPAAASPNYAAERKSLNTILAQKAYQGVTEMSTRERFQEWFFNWLDRVLASLVRFGSRSPWIAWTLRVLLLVAICTALIWFLVRIERRSRGRLIPDVAPAPGAPSAREWQLWLKDAQAMAEKGQWRDAIHFMYWASIARLESRRLWPADRARTPREYLALLAGNDPRKTNLMALTTSFERTWYGGREAAATDFDAAVEQAAALGVGAE